MAVDQLSITSGTETQLIELFAHLTASSFIHVSILNTSFVPDSNAHNAIDEQQRSTTDEANTILPFDHGPDSGFVVARFM
jgi:hypothetical protein